MPLPDDTQAAPAETKPQSVVNYIRQVRGNPQPQDDSINSKNPVHGEIDKAVRLDNQEMKDSEVTAKGLAMSVLQHVSNGIGEMADFVHKEPEGNFQQVLAGDIPTEGAYPELQDKNKVEGFLGGVAQFTTAFLGLGKFAKLAKGTSLALRFTKAALQTGGAQAIGFDPYEARLSNLIQEYPSLANPVNAYLAADPKNSEANNRWKSFLEGAGFGLAGEGATVGFGKLIDVFKAGRAIKATKGDEAAGEFMAKELDAPQMSEPAPVADAAPAPAPKEAQPKPNLEITSDQLEAVKKNYLESIKGGKPITGIPGINIDHLLLPDSALKLKKSVAEVLSGPIESLKANGQHLETIFHNADVAGADPLAVIAKGRSQAADAAQWATDQTAMRILDATYTSAAGDQALLNEAKRAAGTHTPEDDIRLVTLLVRQTEVHADTEAIKSGHARATSANRIDVTGKENVAEQLDNLAPKQDPLVSKPKEPKELLAEILAQPDGSDRLIQLGKVVAGLKDNPKGMGMIARALNQGLQLHNNLWMNAILSRPVSMIRDTIGNTIATVTPPVEKMIGGALRRDPKAFTEGANTFYALGQSFLESMQMAKLSFDNNIAFLDPQNTFTAAEKVALSAVPGESSWANGIRYLGLITEMPTRLRMTSDEFFKQLNARAYTRVKAGQLADELKVAPEDRQAFIERKLDEVISKENGKSLSESATDYAQHATFTQPLNPDSVMGGYERWVNAHPTLRLVTPFVKTPTNLYRWSAQHTPLLAGASSEFKEMWASGGVKKSQAVGMLATGTVIWGTGLTLAAKGLITGGGPRDPDQNKMWRQAGNLPYSVPLGDGRRVSYLSLDPGIATIFGLIGDYYENAGQLTEEGRTSIAEAMLLAVAKSVTSKSMLKGIAQITDAMTATGSNSNGMERFIRSRLASYVPQGIKDIAKALPQDATFHVDDPYLKEVQSIADAMYAKTPFSTGADYRNMFGQRVLIPPGLGEDTISPFATSKVDNDPVYTEMAKYQNGFNRPSPRLSENVRLNSKQYSERLALLDEPNGFTGKTLYEEIKDTIKSSDYKNASDNYTARFGGVSDRQTILIRTIQAYYHDSEQKFLDKNPDIRARVEADREAKADILQNGIKAVPEDPLKILDKYKKK